MPGKLLKLLLSPLFPDLFDIFSQGYTLLPSNLLWLWIDIAELRGAELSLLTLLGCPGALTWCMGLFPRVWRLLAHRVNDCLGWIRCMHSVVGINKLHPGTLAELLANLLILCRQTGRLAVELFCRVALAIPAILLLAGIPHSVEQVA